MKLSDEDRKKLVEKYKDAQSTPCVIVSPNQMKDAATMAWEDVAEYMDELGKKYGFNPKKIKGIDPITGEVAGA